MMVFLLRVWMSVLLTAVFLSLTMAVWLTMPRHHGAAEIFGAITMTAFALTIWTYTIFLAWSVK